jgi:hypothetical protein
MSEVPVAFVLVGRSSSQFNQGIAKLAIVQQLVSELGGLRVFKDFFVNGNHFELKEVVPGIVSKQLRNVSQRGGFNHSFVESLFV